MDDRTGNIYPIDEMGYRAKKKAALENTTTRDEGRKNITLDKYKIRLSKVVQELFKYEKVGKIAEVLNMGERAVYNIKNERYFLENPESERNLRIKGSIHPPKEGEIDEKEAN